MGRGPIARIVREAGVPELVEVLAERLAPTDLQSLLLEVCRRRVSRVVPSDLLARYEANRFVRPSHVDPRTITELERLVWSLMPSGYAALQLSPVCPLGTSSVVATVDQNKVVSTIRNTETVADSTNVLALECAIRRRSRLHDPAHRFDRVCLVTSQSQVRGQVFNAPDADAHFRMIGVAAAGRDEGSLTLEMRSLYETIAYFVSVVARARPEWRIRVAVTDMAARPRTLEEGLLRPLCERFPEITVRMDPERVSGRGYYVDACYKLHAIDREGSEVELADGGCTTWTRRLLSDERERLVIGGLGVDRVLG